MNNRNYTEPTFFINCDHPDIGAFAEKKAEPERDSTETAIALYYAVRDEIRYDPYAVSTEKEKFKASYTLKEGKGYCVSKAVLLAALLRYCNIPARLGFADVTNHLNTENLRESMGTDVFYFHGYTDIFLNGKWVKATPAFNLSLCDKFGVKPLEFDGVNDSIFHPLDQAGRKHMEYINDRGTYEELPFDEIHDCYRKNYPKMYENEENYKGNFEKEAEINKKIK